MPANPYRFNNPVNPDKFIGRKHLVEQIVSDLYMLSGDSYGIVGGRRFGKSSLLRAVEHELLKSILALDIGEEEIENPREKELEVLPVFISLKSLNPDSPDDVFGLIVHRLRKAVCGQKKPLPHFPGPILELGLSNYKEKEYCPASLQNLESVIEEIILAAHERYGTLLRVALLIDEVDAVLDYLWTDKLLGMFRSLVYDSDIRAYIRMVFAGSGRYLHVDEKGSPLLNAIKACFLDPFNETAINDLISWAENISPDLASLVVQQGGGQPFILQHILHYLFEEGIETATPDTVSAETRRFLHDRTQDIDNWWYAIGENGRKTYYLLAQSMTWMTHADMRKSANDANLDIDQGLKALCFHGLVKHDGTYKKFCIDGHLFRDWALKKYQQIESQKADPDSQSGNGTKVNQKAGENALQMGQISGSSITIYHGTTSETAHSFVGVNPEKVEKLRPIVTIIMARFDREEFRTLCFNIGVNYDELTPGGLEAQAIQLVRSCDHSDYLDLLIQEIKRLRPNVNF